MASCAEEVQPEIQSPASIPVVDGDNIGQLIPDPIELELTFVLDIFMLVESGNQSYPADITVMGTVKMDFKALFQNSGYES